MKKYLTLFLFYCITLLVSLTAQAGTLEDIQVKSTETKTDITFNFTLRTQYSYFYMTNPERIVIDFSNSQALPSILPYRVSNSIVSNIRSSQASRSNILRIVLDLENKANAKFRHNGNAVIVTLPNQRSKVTEERGNNKTTVKTTSSSKESADIQSKLTKTSVETTAATSKIVSAQAGKWVIAIDPGHGGKDPGAIGRILNIYEKNITLSIAKELKALLDSDPNFKAVLTRSDDYYISVPERSEIARKHKANYLISIHADASSDSSFKGASVWVLSNQRANSEMGKWLEDHEKQSELLGGAGYVLASHKSEKYLNQTVLDLQFGHAQRVGYELGSTVLRHFSQIASVNRKNPQHASLGVLRSPDIPSILVETGFLSNPTEESQLNSRAHRKKIAKAIYDGLKDYRRRNGKSDIIRSSNKSSSAETSSNKNANKANSSTTDISSKSTTKNTNNAATNNSNNTASKNSNTITNDDNIPEFHIIQQDETLSAVSRKYKIPLNRLLRINDFTDGYVKAGQKIRLKK